MYGLPNDFNFDFFIGLTLEMVCVNANQIYLHFDRDVSLTIEDAYSLQDERFDILSQLRAPEVRLDLFALIERSLVSATGEKSGTLILGFDNGAIFRCYDLSDQYESYRITNGNQVTIV